MTKLYGTMTKSLSAPEDEDFLYLEGIATTSAVDEEFDQIITKGMSYKLPLRMLAHHDRKLPIGEVYEIQRQSNKLLVKARVPLKSGLEYIETVVKQIRAGLVNAFSVGVRIVKKQANKSGGVSVLQSILDELSVVTVPGNREATISVVKSLFEEASPDHERINQVKARAARAVIGTTKHLRTNKKEY